MKVNRFLEMRPEAQPLSMIEENLFAYMGLVD
jgi:hypothetical protein